VPLWGSISFGKSVSSHGHAEGHILSRSEGRRRPEFDFMNPGLKREIGGKEVLQIDGIGVYHRLTGAT